jgi:small GTP-binding protein
MAVEYFEKPCNLGNGRILLLQFWDTAGQEQFRSVMRKYYRNAVGAILVYDLVSQDSFAALPGWLKEVKDAAHEKLCVVLVGNKLDRVCKEPPPDPAVLIPADQLKAFTEEHGLTAFQVSAKTGEGVTEALDWLASAVQELGVTSFVPESQEEEQVLLEDNTAPPDQCGC